MWETVYMKITENRLKYWASLKGRKLSPEHRLKVIKTLKPIRKGGTYEEAFGDKVAKQMKEKMSLAKIGRKMPWNSVPDRIGEKSPRWIKNRSLVKKSEKKHLDTRYKSWMLSIKRRDNWKCHMTNESCKGKLEAHHILNWIDYPDLRYKITNGIALCHAHHPRKRSEEKRLESYFMKLVSVSK